MAQGDFTVFNEFKQNMSDSGGTTGVSLIGDTFKIALVTNATVPTASTTSPDLGDFTEVSGNGYTAGGETATITYSESGGTATCALGGGGVSWTSSGSGDATNIYYAILYSTTHTGSEDAVGFIDMTTDGGTTPLDLNNGDITINAGNLFTLA